jgi:hypothetical protein
MESTSPDVARLSATTGPIGMLRTPALAGGARAVVDSLIRKESN